MDWIRNGLVALAIGLPAMLALLLVVATGKLARLRLRRSKLAMLDPAAVPPQVRATLETAKAWLLAQGFEFRYSTACERGLVTDDASLLYSDVYQHADKHSHAIVTPSTSPEQGGSCTVMWATQLQSGRVLATVNCYLHNLISGPAGWVMYDDYLPGLPQAWQAHQGRLPANRQAIVTDGVEFFRAMKQATDYLVPYCEKKGLLVRRGPYWQMPWRRALLVACRLLRGQRRAARVRASSARAAVAGQARAPARGVARAAGRMAIPLAMVLALLAAAWLAVPQFAGLASLVVAGYERVPDDVEPESEPAFEEAGRDWYAEAAEVDALPQPQRLAVLLGAADHASDMEEPERLQEFLQAAWAIAETRPLRDHERARTLLAMARHGEQPEQRRQWYRQLVAGLDGLDDGPSLLLLAQAKEEMAGDGELAGDERVALLREVVAHRLQALEAGAPSLSMARRTLAQALDRQGAAGEAEALLAANVEAVPLPAAGDRSRAALQRRVARVQAQVELGWFLTAHGRAREAATLLQAALAAVPARVSESWEHPHRQAREAQLWAGLALADPQAVRQGWQQYEDSRSRIPAQGGPVLLHEIDRFTVAQALADDALRVEAAAKLAQAMQGHQAVYARAMLCGEQRAFPQWRERQWQARVAAASQAGVCAAAPDATPRPGQPLQ